MDLKYFKSSSEFRKWLEKNHSKAAELWVGFYKINSNLKGISYKEAVDQALCFGWIDGIKKKVDELSYTHRFTPRKSKSNWSSTNIKRVGELTKLGLMHPSGITVFNQRDKEKIKQYSYERKTETLDKSYEELFKTNSNAWTFFQSQPPSYQKVAILWVMTAKKEDTRLRRLNTLIQDSANNKRLAVVTLEPKKD
ncbi:MAG: YdeI/OmpD-associated family protein [Ignavibacteriaceae bacterium]|nr:YdeI/OmpD-associated family protein [Ignavibacteriaceae bacterium]